MSTRQSKEQLRAEIEQLRKQLKQAESILAALVSNDGSEDILRQLRSGKRLEDISERLDEENTHIGEGDANDAGFRGEYLHHNILADE